MTRREAEILLSDEKNQIGTYMVRQSERYPNQCCLSLKCFNEQKGHTIRHYRILRANEKFYLKPDILFCSITELVEYYSSESQRKT